MITCKDIYISCSGLDQNKMPKCSIALKTFKIDVKTGSEEEVDFISIYNAEVNIFKNFRNTIIDLKFYSPDDINLLSSLKMLKDFSDVQNSLDDEADIIPSTGLILIPNEYDGDYFVSGIHATWCLTSDKPEGPNTTIRFIFDNDMVSVHYREREEEDNLSTEV